MHTIPPTVIGAMRNAAPTVASQPTPDPINKTPPRNAPPTAAAKPQNCIFHATVKHQELPPELRCILRCPSFVSFLTELVSMVVRADKLVPKRRYLEVEFTYCVDGLTAHHTREA